MARALFPVSGPATLVVVCGVRRELRDIIRRNYITPDHRFAGVTSLDGGDYCKVWLSSRT